MKQHWLGVSQNLGKEGVQNAFCTPKIWDAPRWLRSPIHLFLFYGLWTLCLTYPLILHPFTHIPLGDEKAGTVPLFNLWTLQWNIDQLMQGYPHYWDAPIFAPLKDTFAFSETQPLSALLAAPLWLHSATLGYNAVIVLFLTLNGWFAYWLLKNWGVTALPAFLAGLIMQSLPFIAQEMGVLQLTAIFGVLWSLLFMTRWLAAHQRVGSNRRNVIGLALGTPVTFLTCGYYGLFSIFFLPLFFACQFRPKYLKVGFLIQLFVIGVLIAALSGPFLLAQKRRLDQHRFTRSAQTIENNSARLSYYANFLDYNLWYSRFLGLESGLGQRLLPGVGLIALAIVGLFGFAQPRVKLYLVIAVILALLLSLGLRLRWGDIQPYQWIRDYVPGFLQLRSPFRFAALAQMHLALLAGFGLFNLQGWFDPKTPREHLVIPKPERKGRGSNGFDGFFNFFICTVRAIRVPFQFWQGLAHLLLNYQTVSSKERSEKVQFFTPRKMTLSILIIAAIFVILESLALPLPLQPIPDLQSQTAWQVWLRQQENPTRIVMLPFAASNKVEDFEQTTRWMLESRHFQAEMLNGYSGFFPPEHPRLREVMLEFPTNEGLDLLREWHVDYVIIDHNLEGTSLATDVVKYLPLAFYDERSNVIIYSLKPSR